jgi:hypothetical protein
LANFEFLKLEFLKNKIKFDILWMKIWKKKNSIKKNTPKNSTNVNRIMDNVNTASNPYNFDSFKIKNSTRNWGSKFLEAIKTRTQI